MSKTKILVLGGSGMLGHKLWQVLSGRFDVYVTLRQPLENYARYNIFKVEHTIDGVSVENFESIIQAVDKVRPEVVVNSIGVVKQAESAQDPLTSISINALLPHRLAQLCREKGIRLIHISTDCVFSGRKGNYAESDEADATDLYGRSKILGEVAGEGCLTLRTSMIGRELGTAHGLLEWFLSQQGQKISGYRRAIFSGFTTNALAGIIGMVIERFPNLAGIWHIASTPISKFDLLFLIKEVYKLDVHIEPDETVIVDRSLNGRRFVEATGFITPSWYDMIEQMYQDLTRYLR